MVSSRLRRHCCTRQSRCPSSPITIGIRRHSPYKLPTRHCCPPNGTRSSHHGHDVQIRHHWWSSHGIGVSVPGPSAVYDLKLIGLQLERPPSETTTLFPSFHQPAQGRMIGDHDEPRAMQVVVEKRKPVDDTEALPLTHAVVSLRP